MGRGVQRKDEQCAHPQILLASAGVRRKASGSQVPKYNAHDTGKVKRERQTTSRAVKDKTTGNVLGSSKNMCLAIYDCAFMRKKSLFLRKVLRKSSDREGGPKGKVITDP